MRNGAEGEPRFRRSRRAASWRPGARSQVTARKVCGQSPPSTPRRQFPQSRRVDSLPSSLNIVWTKLLPNAVEHPYGTKLQLRLRNLYFEFLDSIRLRAAPAADRHDRPFAFRLRGAGASDSRLHYAVGYWQPHIGSLSPVLVELATPPLRPARQNH